MSGTRTLVILATNFARNFAQDVAENGLQGQELGDQAVFNIDGK